MGNFCVCRRTHGYRQHESQQPCVVPVRTSVASVCQQSSSEACPSSDASHETTQLSSFEARVTDPGVSSIQSCHQSSSIQTGQLSSCLEATPLTSVPEGVTCRMRIISINDVYELDNLPHLKTLIEERSKGWPRENVVTCLAGDFLAPSLLSSLDAGRGMVKVLNALPIDIVCFGNHESDIAHPKLKQRIEEFEGTWLNSNMPDFEPKLPCYILRRLRGEPLAGQTEGCEAARTVGFIGLCLGGGRFSSVFRDGAFGGAAATMIPVLEAAPQVRKELQKEHPEVDEVIPLTHQDLKEDAVLAESGDYPVIVAGHDHELIRDRYNVINGQRGSCPVVKAGMDATHAAVVDVIWNSEKGGCPEVMVSLEKVENFKADGELMKKIDRIKRPVRELEMATIYELPEGTTVTSVGVRYHEASMARLVATALRDCLSCDAAIINSGAVRGNREYTNGISYGDLRRECPFPSPIVVTRMPFGLLRRAVQESRRPWWDIPEGEQPRETPSALQLDDGMSVDEQHGPISIGNQPPEGDDKLYAVACDTRVLGRNKVLKEYCDMFPERIPPEDAGRPVLPLLAEYFCGQLWRRLLDTACPAVPKVEGRLRAHSLSNAFPLLDSDSNKFVDIVELTRAVERYLGTNLSSRIVVEQMIAMLDHDNDGRVSRTELRHGMTKIIDGIEPILMSL